MYEPVPPSAMHRIVSDLGPLRALMLLVVLLSIASAPFAGGEPDFRFPQVLTTLVAPPLAVLLAFVLPLDVMMSLVFRAGAELDARPRYVRVVRLEVIAWCVLVAVWWPFFSELTRR